MEVIKQNWIGLIGLIGLCAGIPMSPGIVQNIFNVVALLALVIYAWRGKNDFFFYLELVVLFGTILKIANVSDAVVAISLVVASLLALAKVFQNPIYRVWYTSFGLIGLAGLVYGYSTLSNVGYAIGGIASVIYSFIGYSKGVKSAFIFGVLNIIYSALAIFMLINH